MKFSLSRDNLLRSESAVAVFLLVYALLAGLFYKGVPVDRVQVTNWYFNYSLGYNHRGLMGSIFQFFHGDPDQQLIQQVIPRWDYNLLAALIILTWALLAPPILLIRADRRQKWFLLAVAAVLLLAPVWRINAINIGFMDKWVFLVSLGAVAAIVLKRPFIHLIFCLTGFLIHPMMIFFALLFVMLIGHAVYFIEAYQAKYKQWLAAAAVPLLVSLLLYFLNNPQNNLDLLQAYDYREDPLFMERVKFDFLHPEQLSLGIFADWAVVPRNFALGVLIFGGAPVLFSAGVAFFLYKSQMRFRSNITKKLGGKIPLLAAVEKYQLFILLPAASAAFLPIHTTSGDWSRHFYWAWWSIALVMIYLVWTMPQSRDQLAQPKKRRKKQQNKAKNNAMPAPVIALFFAWAYLYGGAPLNVSHIHAPYVFFCQQFCIPGLTVHRPGEIYANAIFTTLKDAILPFQVSAKQIRDKAIQIYYSPLIRLEDNKLAVAAEYEDFIFKFFFITDGSKPLTVTADYESADIPNLYLSVYDQKVQPVKITNSQAQWRFALPFGNPGYGFANFQIAAEGGVPFALAGLSVKREEK